MDLHPNVFYTISKSALFPENYLFKSFWNSAKLGQ